MLSSVTRVSGIVHCVLPDVGRHVLARVGQGKLADKRAILLWQGGSLVLEKDDTIGQYTIEIKWGFAPIMLAFHRQVFEERTDVGVILHYASFAAYKVGERRNANIDALTSLVYGLQGVMK